MNAQSKNFEYPQHKHRPTDISFFGSNSSFSAIMGLPPAAANESHNIAESRMEVSKQQFKIRTLNPQERRHEPSIYDRCNLSGLPSNSVTQIQLLEAKDRNLKEAASVPSHLLKMMSTTGTLSFAGT